MSLRQTWFLIYHDKVSCNHGNRYDASTACNRIIKVARFLRGVKNHHPAFHQFSEIKIVF